MLIKRGTYIMEPKIESFLIKLGFNKCTLEQGVYVKDQMKFN